MEMTEVILGENVEHNFFKRSEIAISESQRAIYLKNNGNCCWQIYEKENRRGQRVVIMLGGDLRPLFEPRAFKKHDCPPLPSP